MANYTIGQVERLTGIKPHVLRYWEEVIPSIAPKKDSGGRRVYSQHDVEVIHRLKYLIYTRGFTVEGARKQLIVEAESYGENFETLQQIQDLRETLGQLYLQLHGEEKK